MTGPGGTIVGRVLRNATHDALDHLADGPRFVSFIPVHAPEITDVE
jgi:hypothetical protein